MNIMFYLIRVKHRKGKRDHFGCFSVNLTQGHDGDCLAHFVKLPNFSAFAETSEQALIEWVILFSSVDPPNNCCKLSAGAG